MGVVVFDFDGVIIPSEEIKQSGYSWIFSEYGEPVPHEAIKAAREEFASAKGDRYDIIRGILTRIGTSTERLEEAVLTYAERFSQLVNRKIEAFQVAPDIATLLERLSKTNVLYINSNTPDRVLGPVLSKLGIDSYFKGVFGSSTSKTDSLRAIARAEHAGPKDMVFVGDGIGDRDAAQEFGCRFIGIATRQNGWSPDGVSVLASVADLARGVV